MSDYLLAFLVTSVAGLIAWLAYLQFGRFLVKTTKDPASLQHGAEFAKGYRAVWLSGLAEVVGKLKAAVPGRKD